MTYEGAKWRAKAAQEKLPTADVFIGIENGMYERDGNEKKYDYRKRPLDGHWIDVAAIVILCKDGTETVLWSDTIEIPANAEPSEDGEWTYRRDPHSWLTNNARPRAKFLSDCLKTYKIWYKVFYDVTSTVNGLSRISLPSTFIWILCIPNALGL